MKLWDTVFIEYINQIKKLCKLKCHAKFYPCADPKISIIKNPPLELRKMLRKIRFDMNDLKTLLDIPLTIMSEQNILALVAQNNDSTDHVDPKDPGIGRKLRIIK